MNLLKEGYTDKGKYYYKNIIDDYGEMAIYIYKEPQTTIIKDKTILYDRLEIERFIGALDHQEQTNAFYYYKGEIVATD